MTNRQDIAAAVQEILSSRVHEPAQLHDDMTLGSTGLGLDSIAIAEVLLECEQRFDAPVIRLLEGEPITVRRLVDYFGDANGP